MQEGVHQPQQAWKLLPDFPFSYLKPLSALSLVKRCIDHWHHGWSQCRNGRGSRGGEPLYFWNAGTWSHGASAKGVRWYSPRSYRLREMRLSPSQFQWLWSFQLTPCSLPIRYSPAKYYESDPNLKRALDNIRDGVFSAGDASVFHAVFESLVFQDRYEMSWYHLTCLCIKILKYVYRNHWLSKMWYEQRAVLSIAHTTGSAVKVLCTCWLFGLRCGTRRGCRSL